MKKLLFLLLLICSQISYSQEAKQKETSLEFYGFVRVDAYMDTYKGVDAGHDIFYLLPAYKTSNGVEYNDQTSSNISAIASRLGVRINFPDVLNAKSTGLLEFDFAGNLKSDPTLFRIRQAYSLMTWKNSSLLVGQTWHPFSSNTCLPTVAGLNTGAPFSCFNRSPMVKYNMKFGALTMSASAVAQIQYNSVAIDAAELGFVTPNNAKRNGVIPELVLTGELSSKSVILGAGVSYNRIKPRMMITGTTSDNTKVSSLADEFLNSMAFTAYARYKTQKLTILAKGFLGDNMSHYTLPGGYGVATFDASTGKETYTSYKTYTSYINLVYGQKWQGGLFLGYGGNLGTSKALWNSGNGVAKTYGSMQTVQSMYRVAPHISLNLAKFKLVAEYEMTSANYGTGNINLADGLYSATKQAVNNRVILVLTHSF